MSLRERLKPAAPARVHLATAASMWSVVGVALASFGLRWLSESDASIRWWLAVVAVALGVAKSRWVIDRAATRLANRIIERGDGHCIGGFISPGSWLLIGVMAGGGRLLRAYVLSPLWAGTLYLLVGTALGLSSIGLWRRWAKLRRAGT